MEPSMRLKVTGDTFFLPDPEGVVYFRNNKVSFRIKGHQIDRWIEQLIPMFTGEHSLAELTDGLPKAHRERVYEIAASLHQNGFVRDVSRDRPHRLPKPVLDKYAAQIEFLDSFGGSGASRFEAYRGAKVLAAGRGPILVSFVSALLESGLPSFRVLNAGATEEERRRIGELAAHARLSDPEVRVEWLQENPGGIDAWRKIVAPFQAVLYASMEEDKSDFRELHLACRQEGTMLLPALLAGQAGMAGPIVAPDSEGCWESAWRRLHRSAIERDPRIHVLSSPAEGMLANVLVFELFKALADVPDHALRNECYLLDLETLEGARHYFAPHPEAAGVPDRKPRKLDPMNVKGGSKGDADTAKLFAAFSRLTSPVAGIFHQWDEGDWKQLPLSLCLVQAADPRSAGPADLLPPVLCGGFTHEEARREALIAGVESYARRWHGNRFPVSGMRMGIGAGLTAAEGVCRGLHFLLQEQLGARIRSEQPSEISELEEEISDKRCQFYLRSLTIMAGKPDVLKGHDASGFPVRWVRCAGAWYGAAGLTGTAALREALALAAMAVQTADEAEPPERSALRPALDAGELEAAYDSAVRILKRQGLRLEVCDLAAEPFMREHLAGVFGVALGKEETP